MNKFKDDIVKILASVIPELSEEEIDSYIEIPKDSTNGDIAFPCFKLAKIFRKAPNMISEDIVDKINTDDYDVEVKGAYINFYIKRDTLAKDVISRILKEGSDYGKSTLGEGKNIIVEYSSANISKELHVGHIRGIMIGLSLYKIYKTLGYNPIAINHLGDYGINFGKIITAFKHWGTKEDVEKRGVRALLDLYVKFGRESEKDPKYMDEARNWFKKLEEDKDEHALELWQWFKEVSLKEYNKVYDRLHCHFDSFAGESFYSDMMPSVRQELASKDLLVKDDGAEIVVLEDENLPNMVVTTSNGTSLYITRDIACAKYRKETYNFDKCLYVVGSEQKLHFMQLKAVLKKMGYDWTDDIEHVANGLIMLKDDNDSIGKVSSREGNHFFLEDMLNLAVEKTMELINRKNPDLENKELVAEQIGIGAIAFKELSTSIGKDYVFDWDSVLSFDGETGPYLQYTNVRCNSLLEKGEIKEVVDYSVLNDDYSYELIRDLAQYPETIVTAQAKNEPAVISRYLINLAKTFNRFYQNVTVVSDDEVDTSTKLSLVKATRQTLVNGLYLINIEAPTKM